MNAFPICSASYIVDGNFKIYYYTSSFIPLFFFFFKFIHQPGPRYEEIPSDTAWSGFTVMWSVFISIMYIRQSKEEYTQDIKFTTYI